MANKIYPIAFHHLGKKTFSWDTGAFRAIIAQPGYTFDPTDEVVADLGGLTYGSAVSLASPAISWFTGNIVWDLADFVLPDPGAGLVTQAIIIYENADPQYLIAYIDTFGDGSLPHTNDGAGSDTIQLNSLGVIRLTNIFSARNYRVTMLDEFGISGSNFDTDTMEVWMVGLNYLIASGQGSDADLSAILEANEVTPHTQVTPLTWGGGASGYGYLNGPATLALPNDASGTLASILAYIKYSGSTFNPASPATNRDQTLLLCFSPVSPTVAMDGVDDTLNVGEFWGIAAA